MNQVLNERNAKTKIAHHRPPDGFLIMKVAERYGVLPDDIEDRMSEYWFDRTVELMEGEGLHQESEQKELEANRKR